MDRPADAISINGVAIAVEGGTSPALAAARELLRQRAVAVGLIAADAPTEAVLAGIEGLLDQEIRTPSPTSAECRRYYDAHPEKFTSGDLVFVRHILFQVTPGSRIALIREQAEQTLQQVITALDPSSRPARSRCRIVRRGFRAAISVNSAAAIPCRNSKRRCSATPGSASCRASSKRGTVFRIIAIDRRVAGERLPFEIARDRIAAYLSEKVQQVAIRQYVRLLAGQAEVIGVDLHGASSPLVQ